MNFRQVAWIGVVALVCGCSSHVVSGTYIGKGQNFVEMLQITQGQDGNLLGSMVSTQLNANGTITQDTNNVSGMTDGHSITIVNKSPGPLSSGLNMSGTIDGWAITLAMSNGSARFTKGSADDYQAAVQQLHAQGVAIQQRLKAEADETERQKNVAIAEANLQKHLANQNAIVADLNKQLTDYATKVQSPEAIRETNAFHTVHANALAKVKHG